MARNDQRWHWAPEELALASGPDAGFWIADGLRRGAFDVGGLVPPVFDAFARVFHPVYLHDGDDWTRVNWGTIARQHGTTAHAAMSWQTITGTHRPGNDPEEGSLPRPEASVLATILRHHTTTPDECWFAIWDGYGDEGRPPAGIERLDASRNMVVLHGPITAAEARFGAAPHHSGGGCSANLWWPNDHTWCVATDIDHKSTHVGGNSACIDAILTDPRLEAFPVSGTQFIGWAADTVNPHPPHGT
ncbi:hypothetical protein GS463_24475 [Rhodococcus hoagii]|uniref:Uncharacterized protein n=1 Tax=Rhodococcus hoagii TaxID=43767 RepID=A0AAE2W7V3_RHOHA|nr:hypothetical protein [Prescottella equi]MBM4715568.1 hypothetical protein [Prescottella equi]NKS13742.1 hypothetical protein [Prescottella equi]NKS26384.1 hypothetical protein [Prescottella equi]